MIYGDQDQNNDNQKSMTTTTQMTHYSHQDQKKGNTHSGTMTRSATSENCNQKIIQDVGQSPSVLGTHNVNGGVNAVVGGHNHIGIATASNSMHSAANSSA
jgi:hypothetical protein